MILRLCMVGLVLVNLAFVQITDSASWSWLAPLFALTVAAPLLLRLTRFLWYRLAWNGAVVGVFALLVKNTTSSGPAHLLEDGLRLAALCQVHLLNNINRQQKPDLLFFNSFLIAVVTSFLSLDLAYSVLFLVYAPLLVVSMQLLVLERAGVRQVGWSTLAGGLLRTAVVVLLTLGVFLLVPRDFTRRGLLGDFRPPGGLREVGFRENIQLDLSGEAAVNDRVVMRVRMERGAMANVPAYWRGATLDIFYTRQLKPASPLVVEEIEPWRAMRPGAWRRRSRGFGARVEVELEARAARRLFAPLQATRLELQPPADRIPAAPSRDRTFSVRRPGRWQRYLRYTLDLEPQHAADREPRRQTGHVDTHVLLYRNSYPETARRLARALRRDLAPDAPRHEVVERMRRFLSSYNSYLPPGTPGGSRSLEDFFDRRAGAHCEIFATALAVMLRTQLIPCRVVTGYCSTEWDEDGRVLTIRALHAHAWVEVLDPYRGWYTVDATPALDPQAAAAGRGWWTRTRSWAAAAWTRVTGFNAAARANALAWVAVTLRWWHGLAFVAAAGLIWQLRRRRRRRGHPADVGDYLRCLARLGLTREPEETPRELLDRIELAPERQRRLEDATAVHERARYAP